MIDELAAFPVMAHYPGMCAPQHTAGIFQTMYFQGRWSI